MKKVLISAIILSIIALMFLGYTNSKNKKPKLIAKNFLINYYTINNDEIDKYVKNIHKYIGKELKNGIKKETFDKLHKHIKKYVSDDVYMYIIGDRLLLEQWKNCYENQYTTSVDSIKLKRDNTFSDKNTVKYSFEIQLTMHHKKSNDNKTVTLNDIIFLTNINNEWKISKFRSAYPWGKNLIMIHSTVSL
ncbi:hypothetical protein CLTEP_18360 [Clostridium tepidiprofundi DSM 19306]|uniref:Uncharacterized protein n=1 Tax=Clostridium tepidiprofundi DSM 19306 TaxID=1121338 RepID=A0A151B2X4_9CLOT|nr:hypothetical protein [Clostridium tepidiprofundi]KYH34261.1 hypothetical protein CLTEP_18360 [Clostridium tepidiprofundi DSM 19306]